MKDVDFSRLILIIVAVTVVGVDQLTKTWISTHFDEYVTVELISGLSPIFSITPIRNTGGIFGLFPQLGHLLKYLSLLVVIAVLLYQRSIPQHQYWMHLSLGFVCGGALSNVVDRFLHGYVLDFIDVNFWPLRYLPLFNLADSAIMVGAGVMLMDAVLSKSGTVVQNA
jgi:signal peptidase II